MSLTCLENINFLACDFFFFFFPFPRAHVLLNLPLIGGAGPSCGNDRGAVLDLEGGGELGGRGGG